METTDQKLDKIIRHNSFIFYVCLVLLFLVASIWFNTVIKG